MKNKGLKKRMLALGITAVMMGSTLSGSCPMNVSAEETVEDAIPAEEELENVVEIEEPQETDEGVTEEPQETDEGVTEEPQETDEGVTEKPQETDEGVTEEPQEADEDEAEDLQQSGQKESEQVELEEPESTEIEVVQEMDAQKASEQVIEISEPEEEELQEGILDAEELEALPDNNELFAGYVQQVMYGDDGISLYANYGEESLSGTDRALYRCLKRRVEQVAAGTLTSTFFQIPQNEILSEGGSLDQLYGNKIAVGSVVLTALRDCPYEFYWYNTAGYSYRYAYETQCYELYLPVVPDYQGEDQFSVNGAKLSRVRTAVQNARQMVDQCRGLDDYQKLVTYRNKICELTRYNYDAAYNADIPYGDPWQMIYVFDGDPDTNVVCEGYAKAFQYLCDQTDFSNQIVCYTVTGGMNNAGHMWNVVKMEDGKNYLVDVTNCDIIPEEYVDDLFLAGNSGGSLESGYAIYAWGENMIYCYDDNARAVYGEDALILASSHYAPSGSGTTVNPLPSNPGQPSNPSSPTTPEQPSVPEQPSAPATPTQPEQPSEEPEVEPDTLNVTVGNIKVQSYTGKGITPKITVKDPATRKKLKQGKHYTVSYENNVNVGTAAIVIRGIDANGYSGVKHVYFTIQPQTVAKKMKASAAGKKFLYTGYELTPGVNLTYNKMKLTEGVDYVVSYSNNVEKGTAKIFITGIGNYTGSRTVKFKITGPKLKDAQVSLVQNGTPYPDITVTYAGRTLAEGQDYIVKYPKVVKQGINRIIVSGRGSFSGSVKLTYYAEGL